MKSESRVSKKGRYVRQSSLPKRDCQARKELEGEANRTGASGLSPPPSLRHLVVRTGSCGETIGRVRGLIVVQRASGGPATPRQSPRNRAPGVPRWLPPPHARQRGSLNLS